MIRLFGLLLFAFFLSFLCFATVKAFVVVVAVLVYGGHYSWGVEDVRFILVRGACLGVVFSIFVVIQYMRTRK
jgi:hypothetical protein